MGHRLTRRISKTVQLFNATCQKYYAATYVGQIVIGPVSCRNPVCVIPQVCRNSHQAFRSLYPSDSVRPQDAVLPECCHPERCLEKNLLD